MSGHDLTTRRPSVVAAVIVVTYLSIRITFSCWLASSVAVPDRGGPVRLSARAAPCWPGRAAERRTAPAGTSRRHTGGTCPRRDEPVSASKAPNVSAASRSASAISHRGPERYFTLTRAGNDCDRGPAPYGSEPWRRHLNNGRSNSRNILQVFNFLCRLRAGAGTSRRWRSAS